MDQLAILFSKKFCVFATVMTWKSQTEATSDEFLHQHPWPALCRSIVDSCWFYVPTLMDFIPMFSADLSASSISTCTVRSAGWGIRSGKTVDTRTIMLSYPSEVEDGWEIFQLHLKWRFELENWRIIYKWGIVEGIQVDFLLHIYILEAPNIASNMICAKPEICHGHRTHFR